MVGQERIDQAPARASTTLLKITVCSWGSSIEGSLSQMSTSRFPLSVMA